MAASEVEVLNRVQGLKEGILPTGRKVGIVPVPGTSMYELRYTDGKPGQVPERYNSRFTSQVWANKFKESWLTEFWDMSDQQAAKLKK
jgi:hypothetical protein